MVDEEKRVANATAAAAGAGTGTGTGAGAGAAAVEAALEEVDSMLGSLDKYFEYK